MKVTLNGCTSGESVAIATTVNPLPAKPVITSNGIALSTGTGYSFYQWHFNNSLIAGARTNQYSTTQNGVYKVVVMDNKGCVNTSDDFNYVTTAVNDIVLPGYEIQWFPNPVRDDLFIKVSTGTGLPGIATIRVVDIMGKLIRKEQVLKYGLNKVPLEKLPAGVYWVLFKSGQSEKAVKLLKVH